MRSRQMEAQLDAADAPVLRRPGTARVVLAALAGVGGLLGMTNLAAAGALLPGLYKDVYGTAMLGCLVLAAVLAMRRDLVETDILALVLFGDAIYVTVAFCLRHPLHFAGPVMLLFPTMVAAWFLGRRLLWVQMVAVAVSCALALGGQYSSAVAALSQVTVSSVVLDGTALMVFTLRRHVEGLLVQAQHLARIDPLTGLANRRHLHEHLAALPLRSRPDQDGGYVAAVVLDVDRFKSVNDRYGHTVGDEVLKAVTGQVLTTVRPGDLVVRMGGEEVLVVALCEAPGQAHMLAERLRISVRSSPLPPGIDEAITASVGVAVAASAPTMSADRLWGLIDEADAAMYQAKVAGRDRTVLVAGDAT